MAKIFSLMSRLYSEVKKNGVSNTYYKVKEKQAKNEAEKGYDEERLLELPTAEELDELRTNCTWVWTTQNGVSGRKVTGPNGNSIFLPSAGYRDEGGLRKETAQGYYWTGTLDGALNVYHRAYRLYFCQSYVRTEATERYIGGSIRPVKK
jgi:hypothetical protein